MITSLLFATLLAAAPADNATCPVQGGKVTAASPTVEVRGKAYRICCKGCDKQLAANPDKYLEKDGTPKNAKKAAKA